MFQLSSGDPIPPAGAPGCNTSPIGIRGGNHFDYLQQGHLRQDGAMVQHTVPVNDVNPTGCSPIQSSDRRHDTGHRHGPNYGHMDDLADGRSHHPHGDHCDAHGPVDVVR